MTDRFIELYEQHRKPNSEAYNQARCDRYIKEHGKPKDIFGFDIDGVITAGIRPGLNDVIITGRSYCMAKETFELLHSMDIFNPVYFNPNYRANNTREQSGAWKAHMINELPHITKFFEDDPVQWKIIEDETDVEVVYIISDQRK